MNTVKNFFTILFRLNDLSNKLCVPNKTEDLNLSVLQDYKYK